ncbi:hypothetical protein AGDE_06955 [Angomonas deanei]|nr:hypothetical protein AGDE_10426 [Angomonas deanei]EPY36354.1 hypothetical protein AGDE_06955 [Angomonas deanei]|eukprot:EPY28349.1 hypothetical protein AGDE_10426 [Angomonas deanei]
MTEYKKLVALVEQLHQNVDSVLSRNSADVPQLHAAAEEVRSAVHDAAPRLLKMILKARETNPDKQIYNEAMCGKIEILFDSFCREVYRIVDSEEGVEEDNRVNEIKEHILLSEPLVMVDDAASLSAVEDLYAGYTLQKAREEDWQRRVATGLQEVLQYEEQGRALVYAEERQSRAAWVEEQKTHHRAILAHLRRMEEEKKQAEADRQIAEHTAFRTRVVALKTGNVLSFIKDRVPDHYQRAFTDHLFDLVRALLTTPEDPNLRKLRNNNGALMHHFGHPCLHDSSCDAVYSAAEVLWGLIGYSVRYTQQPVPTLANQVAAGTLQDVQLPCGHTLLQHNYTSMGFEDYGERFLELNEPNGLRDPDAWMRWHQTLKDLENLLRTR